jgi:hypothetical protein
MIVSPNNKIILEQRLTYSKEYLYRVQLKSA